ncbi:MAG: peptidoglycan-binding protein [Acetobacteraceae bacterium]|nr:peptidoglycan-binding protein [Acetobacteraceae bacterium]
MSQWTETVRLDASRVGLNGDLRGARNATMLAVLGNPRGDYSADCREPTNPRIADLVVSEDVGPFRVRGLRPAVATLRAIFDDVRAAERDIYDRLGTAGMLCCRFVRGSTSAISNHSWGCAIDLTIDRVLDRRGDNQAQKGLLQIHKHFNRHQFFWGAAFPTEDAMHFEASDQLVREWQASGELGAGGGAPPANDSLLEFGDRGAEVVALQEMLARVLPITLKPDGIFGAQTRAAVIDFQARNGLAPDGKVGPKTMAALRGKVPALV